MNSKTSRRAHKFHATQEAYFRARALFETVRETCCAEDVRRGLIYREEMSDFEKETFEMGLVAVREEAGYYLARAAMQEAEKEMVAWSVEHAKRYSPAHAGMIEELHTKAAKSAVYWPRLVDIAARLAA